MVVVEVVVGKGATVVGVGVRTASTRGAAVTDETHIPTALVTTRRNTKNWRRTFSTLVITKLSLSATPRDTAVMGFNPTRKRIARNSDIWFVISAVVVAFALVGWAFFG